MSQPPPPALDGRYGWFLANAGAWFGAFGMNQAMVAWLVVGELGASDEVTGLVQAAAMLPGLALLFVGGAVADRVESRRLLAVMHALAALPPLALAWAVASGSLTIGWVVVCATALGMLNPFCFPARERMLGELATGHLERAVTGQTMAQFGGQALGMRIVDLASTVGSAPVLCAQAFVVALGLAPTARLPRLPGSGGSRRPSVADVFAGLRFVWHSDLRGIWVLVFGIGLFFGGSYWTVTPLMLRELFGSADGVGALLSMFQVGTLFGSMALLLRGGIRRKGRAMAIALVLAALSVVALGRGLPYPAILATNLAWGLAGAVFVNMSRTLFQMRAPPAERARVLAMNQFGFMAAGPLGSTLAGAISGRIGPLDTLTLFGSAMLVLVAIVVLRTPVLEMK